MRRNRAGWRYERLIFAPRLPDVADHLARQRQADLFLDTLPYNAHTTACDALWAGVPLLTCLGTTFVGRVAASLLKAIGLDELVTHSLEDYEALALKLAHNPAALAALRERLAHNKTTFPLFDTARTTRQIEAAYTAMWQRYQKQEGPISKATGREDGILLRNLLEATARSGMPKPNDQTILRTATSFHQAGKLDKAAELYRQVIGGDRKNFHALHYLGMIEASRGNHGEAKTLLRRIALH